MDSHKDSHQHVTKARSRPTRVRSATVITEHSHCEHVREFLTKNPFPEWLVKEVKSGRDVGERY